MDTFIKNEVPTNEVVPSAKVFSHEDNKAFCLGKHTSFVVPQFFEKPVGR